MDSVNNLFAYGLEDVGGGDMMGFTIHIEVNDSDTPIGFSFRRKYELSLAVVLSVFDKVTHSNSGFNASDTLIETVHYVTMHVGVGGIKQKGNPRASMIHLKSIIVEVGAEGNCLLHALIIAIASLNKGEWIRKITKFQAFFQKYKIVVYAGLNCEIIVYQGYVDSDKRINPLYVEVTKHYHVIANLT